MDHTQTPWTDLEERAFKGRSDEAARAWKWARRLEEMMTRGEKLPTSEGARAFHALHVNEGRRILAILGELK